MRRSWCAGLAVVSVTCAVAYWHVAQPTSSTDPIVPSRQAEPTAPAQALVLPPTAADAVRPNEERAEIAQPAPAAAEPMQLASLPPVEPSIAQEDAGLEDAAAPAPVETAPIAIEAPGTVETAPAAIAPTPVAIAPAAATRTEPDDAPPDLSYLRYYAYSEIQPETKPADTVLAALKNVPPGTPVEEIRRVSALLKLDFTFMKTVAKIESGFDPKQRTGSYIGLFQLSHKEFGMYGSGDILDARDNTVAAALKFMTENIIFEMYTRRNPTFNDIYLIHQQGVEGAVEHLTQPRRLAWQSMCATYEGKEKGEKWCKRAIWGNTLPALKRAWKNVNKVTSADFVGMWRQRVAQFYAEYSKSAAK